MIKRRNISKKTERGQVIVLVAAALVGLVAVFGLMVDGGILLINYGRLKRGIDAASVVAAAQFRKGYQEQDLINAGEELLKYNQAVSTVTVQTCDGTGVNHDQSLCPASGEPKRKLVRVNASRVVTFGFLPLIGIRSTTITASSVGEAASIDMVIALDTSSSMAYETTTTAEDPDANPDVADQANPTYSSPGDDPRVCNAATYVAPGDAGRQAYLDARCEPMGTVIDVAVEFVDSYLLFFPYDRVAVVTTTSQTPDVTGSGMRTGLVLPFNDNQASDGITPTTEIEDAIEGIKVIQPAQCGGDPYQSIWDPTTKGICLLWQQSDPSLYFRDVCLPGTFTGDQSTCGTSNLGGALNMAGDQFVAARQEAYWVVINLFGSPPNATDTNITGAPVDGFCPDVDWGLPGLCRDDDPTSSNRHYLVGSVYDPEYDADDYARDAADHVASPTKGQGATIFAICMGNPCKNYYTAGYADGDSADRLGHYMAEDAGDDTSVSPAVIANHGLYFYSQNTAGLTAIFESIASNIFTRISQ